MSLAVSGRSAGSLSAWNPNPGTSITNQSPSINALVLSGNTLYAGGDFTTNNGLRHLRLAALEQLRGTGWLYACAHELSKIAGRLPVSVIPPAFVPLSPVPPRLCQWSCASGTESAWPLSFSSSLRMNGTARSAQREADG